MNDLGKGLASLGIAIAVAVAVWVTKDVNATFGLFIILALYVFV